MRGSRGSPSQGSAEPSSTTMSSKSCKDWEHTLETARRNIAALLRVGNTIEKRGGGLDVRAGILRSPSMVDSAKANGDEGFRLPPDHRVKSRDIAQALSAKSVSAVRL